MRKVLLLMVVSVVILGAWASEIEDKVDAGDYAMEQIRLYIFKTHAIGYCLKRGTSGGFYPVSYSAADTLALKQKWNAYIDTLNAWADSLSAVKFTIIP